MPQQLGKNSGDIITIFAILLVGLLVGMPLMLCKCGFGVAS